MSFQVFGVNFRIKSDLFKALGYTRMQSQSFVQAKYGTYEDMCKIRLRLQDPDAVKAKLIELKSAYYKDLEGDTHEVKALESDACDASDVSAIYIDALKIFFKVMLSDIDSKKIEDALKIIAVSKDLKVDDLKKALDAFLKG